MPNKVDDALLSAWLDGELSGEQQADVQRWLDDHPEDVRRLQAWRRDDEALREHFDATLDEPVPAALRRRVLPVSVGSPSAGWQVAAAVALLLVGGLAGGGLTWHALADQAREQAVREASAAAWPRRAAQAHLVYAVEQRHPVEVAVAADDPLLQRQQEEHLARWLTRRLDVPVRLFDFLPQGYSLVGGRLLPDGPAPGAQLMYQRADGERITLYLRRPESPEPAAFRIDREGPTTVLYWVEDRIGFALVGRLSRQELTVLANLVCDQLKQPLPTR
ncbi:anti-sigma factor [Aquabacterium sp. J223]|uniref:anti-sigma factor family protein n=1 Tax=Aquabacterium sp. J223 TaxID=2898431 RepID=UPI0021AD6C79|nr:anti-sigma factor [Aquabacterium sp. J223]UUX96261.1 anti-sigma factor [Aquabacterium sp. J223]